MGHKKSFEGKWALVTGASSGIGVALARELALHGAKLILTARRMDRLETLAVELRQQGVEVRVVQADIATAAGIQTVYEATEGSSLQVDVLINNAGLGQYGNFWTGNLDQELSQVRVNCEAVVHLSRLFVPHMVERRQGWVLVVASTASFQPVPFLSTYAATKAFDRFFSEGLAEEVAPFGIKVSALCPGPTESEFFEVSRTGRFRTRMTQPAEEVAQIGVRALIRGKRAVIPNWSGRIGAFGTRFLPVGWITAVVAKVARPKT